MIKDDKSTNEIKSTLDEDVNYVVTNNTDFANVVMTKEVLLVTPFPIFSLIIHILSKLKGPSLMNNNRGQTFALFVVLIPIFVICFAYIFDTGFIIYEKIICRIWLF